MVARSRWLTGNGLGQSEEFAIEVNNNDEANDFETLFGSVVQLIFGSASLQCTNNVISIDRSY
jgi:hypothetical protein